MSVLYLGNLLDIRAKDWLKDTFTAHSKLEPTC